MSNDVKTQPPCPECEKLADVSEESNKIGDFLSWLAGKGYVLAKFNEHSEEYDVEITFNDTSINRLLADYYGIDLDKVEKERRSLLDWIRSLQE